jgi:hypothetical protein
VSKEKLFLYGYETKNSHQLFALVHLFLQTSLQLGSMLMKGLGVMSDDVSFLSKLVRDSMELQALEALNNVKEDTMESLQVHYILTRSMLLFFTLYSISPYDLKYRLQVRVSDLVETNGNGTGMIPREQSLGLSRRPEVRVMKAAPESPIPDLNGNVESDDGVKYCLLETADDDEMVEPPAEARR